MRKSSRPLPMQPQQPRLLPRLPPPLRAVLPRLPAHRRPAPLRRPTRSKRSRARSFEVESTSRSGSLVEHDLFGKPVSTFPDHALEHIPIYLNLDVLQIHMFSHVL